MNRRVFLIANPKAAAGGAATRWRALIDGIHSRGFEVDYAVTTHSGHAVDLAREAGRDHEVIVAVGGDGTVNEVANGILFGGATGTALGIVPLGTGNDVAQLMGLRTFEDTLGALARGDHRWLDVIEVRCQAGGAAVTRYALLYASVGFAGELLKKTTATVKRLFGPRYCYSVGFFRALLSFRSPRMKVSCDEEKFEGPMFLACAGNSEFVAGGVMRLSPGAKMDDGTLNLSVIAALGRWETTREFLRLLKGEHVGHPKVRYFPGTVMAVEAEPVADVQMDGELTGQTPVTFRMKPAALRVLSASGP